MLFETPKLSPAGDRFLLVVFGDELNLDLNFKAQGLAGAIKAEKVTGVIETIPHFASLLIHYDPALISIADLGKVALRLCTSLVGDADLELLSRLFYIPVLYNDPWTKACIEDYVAKIAKREFDPDFLVRLNSLLDTNDLARVHAMSEYWITSIGFRPGLPMLMPLDPRCRLRAPKYNPPRTWTPQGTIGVAGAATCIYATASPGGYQIFGITPVPIWDLAGRLSAFRDNPVLFQPGDRVRFVPVDRSEFDHIRGKVDDGSYTYNFVPYQKFSLKAYKRWLDELDHRDRERSGT